MSVVNELETEENERSLRQIAGKAQHIEINERTIQAVKEEFAKKGLTVSKEEDYPAEDFHLISKQKNFDALVDPSKGIRKIIQTMVRQPVTEFDKKGKAVVKDALYYRGQYYGLDKKDMEIGASFYEGVYQSPKIAFSYVDAANPYDPKTGERRGSYRPTGYKTHHYIFLSEDKKERRKQLEDIIAKCPGTHTSTLTTSKNLSYRNPTPDNNHSGTHGGGFSWDQFCDLSIEELGECQNKNYYTEKSSGALKDKDGVRVAYDHSTKKVESMEKGR